MDMHCIACIPILYTLYSVPYTVQSSSVIGEIGDCQPERDCWKLVTVSNQFRIFTQYSSVLQSLYSK